MEKEHFYFSQIDTEYKAYILGFIYADGCLIKPNGNRQGRLTISIQLEDGYILNPLRQAIVGKDYIVKYSPAQIRAGEKPQAVVNISSQWIYDDLVDLGCPPNKTIAGIKFPNIAEELVHHFIRGFFDGNGCLNVDYPKNSYVSRITGVKLRERNAIRGRLTYTSTDKSFLEALIRIIPHTGYYMETRTKGMETSMLKFERQGDVVGILNYMYKDATVYLKRKRDKANMLISSQASGTPVEGSETTGEVQTS